MTVPHSGRGRGGPWKLAPCLIALEAEADRLAPRRRRTSDGSIGDQSHAARKSDHNPQESGPVDWVDALDISHDPANGMDIHARLRVVAQNVKNGVEDRVSYLISNREIFSQKGGVWAWRNYMTKPGLNPHTLHGHISVKDGPTRFDTSPWFAGVPAFPTAPLPPPYNPSQSKPAGPSAGDLLFIQQLIEEEDSPMIVIREGKGIALLVNSRTVLLNGPAALVRVRDAYKKANKPLPELPLTSDNEWTNFTGLR